MEAPRRYKASLDRTARISTIVFSGLLLFVAWVMIGVLRETNMPAVAYLQIVLLGLIWFLCFGFSPRAFVLTADALVVERVLGNKRIELSSIVETSILTREDISWSLRTFGVGGLFGYFGKFANRKLGAMTWYLTRRDDTVLLRLADGRKILVSPDKPEEFLHELKAIAGVHLGA